MSPHNHFHDIFTKLVTLGLIGAITVPQSSLLVSNSVII